MKCLIVAFFAIFLVSFTNQHTYAADGCYSLSTNRFYYISIGSNNWDGNTYATYNATPSCSNFSSGTYTMATCLIEGTSNANYRVANTDLIYPCPIDDYIPFFVIAFSALGFVFLKKGMNLQMR